MNKYFGWLFILAASMTMVSAYAEDVATSSQEEAEESLAVVLDDEADDSANDADE